MTRASTTMDQPRFRLAHKIAAWYDAEAYFRRRAKSGKAFAMPIPGFGDVLFAAKPVHIREFLKIPASAFTLRAQPDRAGRRRRIDHPSRWRPPQE